MSDFSVSDKLKKAKEMVDTIRLKGYKPFSTSVGDIFAFFQENNIESIEDADKLIESIKGLYSDKNSELSFNDIGDIVFKIADFLVEAKIDINPNKPNKNLYMLISLLLYKVTENISLNDTAIIYSLFESKIKGFNIDDYESKIDIYLYISDIVNEILSYKSGSIKLDSMFSDLLKRSEYDIYIGLNNTISSLLNENSSLRVKWSSVSKSIEDRLRIVSASFEPENYFISPDSVIARLKSTIPVSKKDDDGSNEFRIAGDLEEPTKPVVKDEIKSKPFEGFQRAGDFEPSRLNSTTPVSKNDDGGINEFRIAGDLDETPKSVVKDEDIADDVLASLVNIPGAEVREKGSGYGKKQ